MSNLEIVPCPICETSQYLPLKITSMDLHIQKYGDLYAGKALSEWKTCVKCGFVLQNPRPKLAALNDFYLNSQYHGEISWKPNEYRNFSDWYYSEKVDYVIEKTGLKTGSVFDVGFGLGGALYVFKKRGWKVYGVEADKTSFDFAMREFQLDGAKNDILRGGISGLPQVDVIFSNHAFEHFADLHDVREGIKKILKPGGHIFTSVPTFYSNRSVLSKHWMNSAHYNLFTHNSLNNFLEPVGVSEKTHTYRGFFKEIDEVWHLGQRTEASRSPSLKWSENARWIQFYINVINPIRSALCYPIFHNWSKKVHFFTQFNLRVRRKLKLLLSP